MKSIFILLLFIPLLTNGQEELLIQEVFKLTGHNGGIASLAFSPDGKYLVSGSQDESLKIWDLSTKKEIKTIRKFGSSPTSLAFSPKNDFLAVGFYEKIRIYNTKNWKNISQKELFPASFSMFTVNPALTSDCTTLGVNATRFSKAVVSFGTAINTVFSLLKSRKENNKFRYLIHD